jgi:hypothetical protein
MNTTAVPVEESPWHWLKSAETEKSQSYAAAFQRF